MAKFEYLICSVQMMHITFVNGQWQGELVPQEPGALETCPKVWDFLQELGEEEWELVSVANQPIEQDSGFLTLFLKREIYE